MNAENQEAVRQYEHQTWTRCSRNYRQTWAMLTNQTLPGIIDRLGLHSDSRVLDIGCGPGNSTFLLSQTGADLTGIDFSEKMISVAADKHPELTFKVGDAENLGFDNSTFDAVVANYIVHHLPDPVRVFGEISRVLKSGGTFAFAVWGPLEEQTSVGAFFEAFTHFQDLGELPHGPLFGVTEFEVFNDLTGKGGLRDLQVEILPTEWRCESLDPVIEGFWTWGNLASLPSELQQKIRDRMIANCQAFKDNDAYVFPHSALVGFAQAE
ncbi:MAG: class I SAM-dependent methyltransferase [Puniceicoccaceae bacterium]